MSVYPTYRRIAVGSLNLRIFNRKVDRDWNPVIEDLARFLDDHTTSGGDEIYHYYNDNDRVMWCENYENDGKFLKMILQIGNRNVSDMSRMDMQTREKWNIEMTSENEASRYSAHVLIKVEPDASGDHMILIERVPGIYVASVKNHLNWIFSNEKYCRTIDQEKRKPKVLRMAVSVLGYESTTVSQAIESGVLENIQIFGKKIESRGLDNEPFRRDIECGLKVMFDQKVPKNKMSALVAYIKRLRDEQSQELQDVRVRVKILSNDGQHKTAEIANDIQESFEQAFVRNEIVEGFGNRPLTQSYDGFRDDLVEKMIEVADRVRS